MSFCKLFAFIACLYRSAICAFCAFGLSKERTYGVCDGGMGMSRFWGRSGNLGQVTSFDLPILVADHYCLVFYFHVSHGESTRKTACR